MITTNENIDKALLISVIEGYVFMNTKIFTCLGIMMHLIVKHCVDKNLDLPNNFIDEKCINHAAKWDGRQGGLFSLIEWVIDAYNHC